MTLLQKCMLLTSTLLIILISGFGHSLQAQNDSSSIQKILEQRDREIKKLVGPKGTEYTTEQRDKIKDLVNGVIDYRAMARFALGETFDTLSVDQQDEFVELFSTTIRDQSLNKLDIYRADVQYNSIKVDSNKAVVNTLASLENVRTPVIYDMRYSEETDQWVVTDLTIDDVSTAKSYKRQFSNILRKKSYDFLLQTLRKRAAK